MTEAPPDRPTMEHLIRFYESLAEGIDVILNGKEVTTDKSKRKNGFVLLTFPYDDDSGICNYISNGVNRERIIQMMKIQVADHEGAKNENDIP